MIYFEILVHGPVTNFCSVKLYLLTQHVLKAETRKAVSGSRFIAAAVYSFGSGMHKTALKELRYGKHGECHWINPADGRHL